MLDIERIFAAAKHATDMPQCSNSNQCGAKTTPQSAPGLTDSHTNAGTLLGRNTPVSPGKGGNSHRETRRSPVEVGTLEQASMRVTEGFPTVPTVPTEKNREGETGRSAPPVGAAGSDFCAAQFRGASRPVRHEINPAAVVRCVPFRDRIGATDEEVGAALRTLGQSSPIEEQRAWAASCVSKGLTPWRLLTFPAVPDERDCLGCAHIRSTVGAVRPHERRRFRWACALGYPMREVARASERILTAPPECESWARWAPAER